jgi:hypothetical protein
MAELVDARDLKFLAPKGRVGSIPTPGITKTKEDKNAKQKRRKENNNKKCEITK